MLSGGSQCPINYLNIQGSSHQAIGRISGFHVRNLGWLTVTVNSSTVLFPYNSVQIHPNAPAQADNNFTNMSQPCCLSKTLLERTVGITAWRYHWNTGSSCRFSKDGKKHEGNNMFSEIENITSPVSPGLLVTTLHQ